MEITEPHGSRFELALERFQEGHAFTFRDVGFWLAPDGSVEVQVQTSWKIENATEKTALEDLNIAKKMANALVEESPSFALAVKHRPRLFVLIDNYGMGTIELCRLVDGKVVWAEGMPQSNRREI